MEQEIKKTAQITYRLTEEVMWVVESHCIRVRNAEGEVFDMAYPQAAIWDFVSRKYTIEKMVYILSYVADLPPSEALDLIRSTLEEWSYLGLLKKLAHCTE